jgi:2-keto-4-pentenoate hydratase
MSVQLERWREALRAGAGRAGWKIGFNDPTVQQRFGLETPVVGYLTADRIVGNGGAHVPPRESKLGIEAEVAVTIRRTLGPSPSALEVEGAIGAVAAALELVDYSRPAADLDQILAGDVFHEAVVFGAEAGPLAPDLPARLAVRLAVNGVETEGIVAALVPRSFVDLVLLVAHVLGAHGETLVAGDRIITGSLVQPVRVGAGDSIEAEIDPLGSVSLRIAE